MLCPGARVAKVGWYHARLGCLVCRASQGDEALSAFIRHPDARGMSTNRFPAFSCRMLRCIPFVWRYLVASIWPFGSGRLFSMFCRHPLWLSSTICPLLVLRELPFRPSGTTCPFACGQRGRFRSGFPLRQRPMRVSSDGACAITDPSIAAWSPWHSIVSKRTLPTDLKSAGKQPKPTRLNQWHNYPSYYGTFVSSVQKT